MMLRILLLLICLQVTGAQAQHEITVWAVGSGSNKLYHCPKSRWTAWDRGRRSVNVTPYVKDIGPLLAMAAGHNANRL